MKLGPQAIWKKLIFLKVLFIAISIFILSGCSLSGSIKSVGSQKDEAPASPITSPVTGSDELRLAEPTDYIKPSNQSAYPITGSCKTTGTLTVEVNNTVVKTGVTCTNETFSTTLDLTSIASGDVSIKVYSDSNTEIVSTVTIMKDTVAPSLIGTVIDGTYFNSTSTTPTLTWTAAADAHSGLAEYEIAIGTTAGGTDILNWTSTNSTSATHSQGGLTLIEGTQYFASLRAVDNAGNTSSTIQSDGWTVDATAPTLATSFTDGGEINFSSTSSKVLNWVAGTDAASGVSGYEVALGTTAGATDVMNWTSVGNVITETIDSLTLFGNRRYYASLRSVDVAGNRTASVMSDGWWNLRQTKKAVDTTSPHGRWQSSGTRFGYSIAISEDGNRLVVGAPYDDTDANGANSLSNAGAAFVYVKSGVNWVFQQKLVATGTNSRLSSDQFGFSVSVSGDTIVVGSIGHDYDANGENMISASGAGYVFVLTSGSWLLQQKIVSSGTNARVASDYLGTSVSVSGDTIVIGADYHDYDVNGENFASGAGAAFVFVRASGVWSQQQKLIATGTNARLSQDYFGFSVAINGNTIVVGANYQNFDVNGENSLSNAGAAFVFFRDAGVWSLQQKLVGTGANARMINDLFGYSVAISGETIAVGAYGQSYDSNGNNFVSGAGAVYVFIRSSGVWSLQQKLVTSGTNGRIADDFFGLNISLSGDIIIAGSNYQDFDSSGEANLSRAGASYIFERVADVWSQTQKISASGTNARFVDDWFGFSVAVGANSIAVAAPYHTYDSNGTTPISEAGAVFTFNKPASTWIQVQKIVDDESLASRADLASSGYGSSVAISEDGNTLVVGAAGDDTDDNGSNYVSNAGAVYVYIKNSGVWVFQQKLIAIGTNARVAGDNFGDSVFISGETIVSGSPLQSYDSSGGTLVNSAGAAYVFTRNSGVWSQQQKLVATGTNARITNDNFGESVSVSGETIVVGTQWQDYDANGENLLGGAGAAYVFTRVGGVWTQEQKLVATGTNARISNDNFGISVSISGETIVVGAYGQDYNEAGASNVDFAGAAYVFIRSGGVWTQQQKIVATGVNARVVDDSFGYSVSISGDTIVVGAYCQGYDASGGTLVTNSGAAFIFTRTAGVWTQQQKIVATGVNARASNDRFGRNVVISGNTIVIGSINQDFDAVGENSVTNAGAAYIFRRSGSTWSQELKLTPTGTNSRLASKNFGTSVAIAENESADGYTIGVGASGDVNDSSGGGNAVTGAGSVYIYD